jgi:uncharacterized protein (DUF488 family)
LLKRDGVKRLIDVRLRNRSQLAGFAKAEDLRYFLRAIVGVEYRHLSELAPTPELLDGYKKKRRAWEAYEKGFRAPLESRRIDQSLSRELFDGACLLCSEEKPDRCHRRLVAEYLREKWGDVEIQHLV